MIARTRTEIRRGTTSLPECVRVVPLNTSAEVIYVNHCIVAHDCCASSDHQNVDFIMSSDRCRTELRSKY